MSVYSDVLKEVGETAPYPSRKAFTKFHGYARGNHIGMFDSVKEARKLAQSAPNRLSTKKAMVPQRQPIPPIRRRSLILGMLVSVLIIMISPIPFLRWSIVTHTKTGIRRVTAKSKSISTGMQILRGRFSK